MNNPAFQHILEKILLNLNYEDLVVCQEVIENSNDILNNSLFWLKYKEWALPGLSKKNQKDWSKAIFLTKGTKLETNVITYIKKLIQKNVPIDVPCYINENVVNKFLQNQFEVPKDFEEILTRNQEWIGDHLGSVALLSHFDKMLELSKFALLKCEIEVNPLARIPQATSTAQFQFVWCWWPREFMLWVHFIFAL